MYIPGQADYKFHLEYYGHPSKFGFKDVIHEWKAERFDPEKLIGLYKKAACDAALRFGVSVHASHAWSWYEPSQGSDSSGPFQGVPYDGRLTKADGKGLWWEGFGPQDLYAQNHLPGKKLVWTWEADQGRSVPDAAYCRKFFLRTKQLIDDYKPDLLYFDDTILPLGFDPSIGLGLAAH